MATLGAPSRQTFVHRAREGLLPLALAVLALLSLPYPLVAPIVAIGGGVTAWLTARKTGSRVAWFALVVCAAVLASSLVVDLWFLGADTVLIGHSSGISPN